MNYIARQTRNDIILNMLQSGMSQTAVSQLVDLGQRTISTLYNKFCQNKPLTGKSPGRHAGLDAAQLSELAKFLTDGAESYGFTGNYWTHKRVGYVINKAFSIQYTDKQVGRILAKINWTRQKPQKKDVKQSAEEVKKWTEESLPALKKALEEDYEIYFHDESTLQLCANVVKTYSPRGQTPILRLHDTKGYQYVCLASSISSSGKMFFQIRDNSFKGEGIIDYLKALLNTTLGKIMLIWDNATWHTSQEVKDFLNTELGKRLWVAKLPPYSPELNPDELVWANLKRVQIPNTVAKNVNELKNIAQQGMNIIQNSVQLVKSFFNQENFYPS